jgi:hypothetical protein
MQTFRLVGRVTLLAFVATVMGSAVPARAQSLARVDSAPRCQVYNTSEGAFRECTPDEQRLFEGREKTPEKPYVLIPESQAWKSLFTNTHARLASRRTVQLLGLGAIVAAAAFPYDNEVTRDLSTSESLDNKARPGAVVGSTPFQVGGALILYGLGGALNKPRVQHVAGDLMRAQVLAEVMTVGIKHTVRRKRPDDSGSFSFPSGHTSVSFASATVLQRHFGWKFGVPAYGVAGYVALSRVQMRRHYLSDVAFGAAIGILAGRTVTVGHGRKLELAPVATPGGAALSFRWIGREP